MSKCEIEHELNETDEKILGVLARGKDEDGPWGRDGPTGIAEEIDFTRAYIYNRLRMLSLAGYIRRRTGGVYEITDKGVKEVENDE